jgi:hypothetical protein
VYDEFLKNERDFSARFLKSQQILTDRFSDKEYLVIRELFKNEKMIEKIYEVIDNIIKKEKLYYMSRSLIMGDFLFSICFLNSSDSSCLVSKVSRDDYFNSIKIRTDINKWFDYNDKEYIKVHQKLLLGLRGEKIIERHVIRIKEKDWVSIIYFKLMFKIDSLEEIYPVGLSDFPFIIDLDKKYSIGSFRNVWKLKRKKKEMEDYPICLGSVIKANCIKFKLNMNLYELNRGILNNEIKNMLDYSECISVENYFNKLKKISENKGYIKMSNELKIWIDEESKRIMKIFQKMMSLNMLNRDIFDKEYYLPCFIDNRGRQYYGTLLSPTFYKIFRNMYSFVDEKEFINLEDSRFYKNLIRHKDLVKDFNLNDKESYIALVLLIEIGKNFIKVTDECFVETKDIVEMGISNFYNTGELDLSDAMYVNKIKDELRNLLKKEKVDINTIIFKDATASGLQNYGILLGYKEEMLKYLNINGDSWCDTYQYIVNKFVDDENFKKRKYWKSTIMTIPYNAEKFSCFVRFIEKLENDEIFYKKMNEDEKFYIRSMHERFYWKVKNGIKGEFFKNEKADLINFKYNQWKVIDKKEYKINYNNLRDKYIEKLYEISKDSKSTERSMEANNMHYLDALLVKEILEFFDIISIHDCFGIRLCELHLVMDKINEYYSKKIGKETYGMYILK